MRHLDAQQLARVLDREIRTAQIVLAQLVAEGAESVEIRTGRRPRRAVAIEAVAAHLALAVEDVVRLAA